MLIQILGIREYHETELLKSNLSKAIENLQLTVDIEEVFDIEQITSYNIHDIPAILVDGKVTFQKVIPEVEDLIMVLKKLSNAKTSI